MKDNRITFRSLMLGVLFTALFAWYTVIKENSPGSHILTATQIPVLPYILLILCGVALNPLLKLLRFIRPFSQVEVMIVFMMCMVSAGVSTFGLASQLTPLISGLFNKDWNNEQSRWDLHITPYVNESFFISEPGIRKAAERARDAELEWRKAASTRQAADSLLRARADMDQIRSEQDAARADTDEYRRSIALQRLTHRQAMSQRVLNAVETRWAELGAGQDPIEMAKSLPARTDALHSVFLERQQELRALEAKAFQRVELFRKGLPPDLQALPGLLPLPQERFDVFSHRLRRLVAGMGTVRDLRAAEAELKDSGHAAEAVRTHLQRAAERLQALADTRELEERRAAQVRHRQETEAGIAAAIAEINEARGQRREASADRFKELDRRIRKLETAQAATQKDMDRIAADLRDSIDRRIALAKETASVLSRLTAAQTLVAGNAISDPDGLARNLRETRHALAALGVSMRSCLAGDVP